jgi:tetratricopeptide (TPR) repeat protein
MKNGAENMNTFSIFISSPGDVDDERCRAERVIHSLQHKFDRYLQLEPIFWEHQPQSAHQHFQDQIRKLPSATDLVVCILWSRLGTRLPPDKFLRADGTPYRSGTEFEFEDAMEGYLLSGKAPDLWVYRKTAEVLAPLSDRQRKSEMERQKDMLDDFLDHWLGSADDHFKAGFNGFADADEFERLFAQHLEAVLRARCPQYQKESAELTAWSPDVSPYRGLSYFELEHAPVFHGRTAALHALLGQLQTQAVAGHAFVLVFGASGVGKSSLLRSGVLHALTVEHRAPGVDHWRYAVFRPTEAENGDLLISLAAHLLEDKALPELSAVGFGSADALAAQLRAHPAGLTGPLNQALDQAGDTLRQQRRWNYPPVVRLLLLVDQMEEIFRCEPAQRDGFMAALGAFAASGSVWIVAAMRDEYYPQAAADPLLSALKTGVGQYDLLGPNETELAEMIRYPALAVGMDFESRAGQRLDALLMESATANRNALPLLEFTLDALYQCARRRGGTLLSFADFEALGGLEGAVATAAEAVLEPFGEPALPKVRDLFRQLVELNHGQALPRRANRAELAADPLSAQILERFIDQARLLVSGKDASVEIAHAALLRSWKRLAEWLAEDAELLAIRSRLEELAANWHDAGHDAGYLLNPGKQEQDAKLLLQLPWVKLAEVPATFLKLSLQHIRRRQRGKILTLASAVSAFLLLAGGFGWVNYQEREKAQTAEELTMQVVKRLTYQLPERLATVPGTLQILQETFEQNAELLQRIDTLHGETTETEHEKAVNLDKRGNQRLALGDLAGALESYRASHIVFEKLVAKDPANALWQRDLSLSYNKIGDVLSAQGDFAGALTSYRASLAISEKLAMQDPANAGRQRDLSISYSKVGDVQSAQGDWAGALTSYQASLTINETLVKQDPDNLQWQRDLSVSYSRIGDVQSTRGNWVGALVSHRASLAISKILAKQGPLNAQWQRDLSLSYNKIGDVLSARGDWTGALTSYRTSLTITKKLAQQDSTNAQWQRDLSISYGNIGDVQRAQGDLVGALTSYQASLAIAKKLAGQDLANAEWQSDLAFSHDKLGVLLRLMDKPADALAQYRAALAILTPLSTRAPDQAQWRQALEVAKEQIAAIKAAGGKQEMKQQ